MVTIQNILRISTAVKGCRLSVYAFQIIGVSTRNRDILKLRCDVSKYSISEVSLVEKGNFPLSTVMKIKFIAKMYTQILDTT
jgi:hypothetical protein